MRWLTAMLVGMLLSICWMTTVEAAALRPTPHRRISCRVIPMETFAAFAKNWDGKDTTRTAIIRNLDDWNEVFAPAVVMGDEKPVAPEEEFFEKEALLAVIRIMPSAPEGKENLSLVLLDASKSGDPVRLSLWYDYYGMPEAKGDMLVKSVLLVAAPKDEVPADDKVIHFRRIPHL